MKKIYLAALTLAMTACVSNDDLNPVENYGYIDLNVSNDPIVETRAKIDGADWIVKIGEKDYNNSEQAFEAGNYNILVKSHNTITDAIGETTDWGAAYYSNENAADEYKTIKVEAGKTIKKTIACGKAQNTRMTVEFTQQFITVFPTYALNVTTPKTLEFNANNNRAKEKYAYFTEKEEVSFTITYAKQGNEGTTTEPRTITLGDAGTEKIISVTANTHGNIQLSITTEGFSTTQTENITFDAATGQEVVKQNS